MLPPDRNYYHEILLSMGTGNCLRHQIIIQQLVKKNKKITYSKFLSYGFQTQNGVRLYSQFASLLNNHLASFLGINQCFQILEFCFNLSKSELIFT